MSAKTEVAPHGAPGAEAPLRSRDTEQLQPNDPPVSLDALPLVDHRLRAHAIAPQLALRGHYLELTDGPTTRLLRLDRAITRLGRGTGADVRIDEYRVSREHAILVRHGRYFRLLDNRSANGTFVNGRQIVATNIVSGDVISLGPVHVRYVEVP
jgi:pSer/pThr/pTyr-binding forkhead associated (FHA) protein